MKFAIARTLLSLLLLPPVAVVAQKPRHLAKPNYRMPTSSDGIRLGTLTYQPGQAGTNAEGTGGYYLTLDATYNASFGSAVIYINGIQQASGPISTPVSLLYVGGDAPFVLPSCVTGCVAISVQLISPDGKPMTFTRWDGLKYQTAGANTITLSPQPGQVVIVPGQSVGIYLSTSQGQL